VGVRLRGGKRGETGNQGSHLAPALLGWGSSLPKPFPAEGGCDGELWLGWEQGWTADGFEVFGQIAHKRLSVPMCYVCGPLYVHFCGDALDHSVSGLSAYWPVPLKMGLLGQDATSGELYSGPRPHYGPDRESGYVTQLFCVPPSDARVTNRSYRHYYLRVRRPCGIVSGWDCPTWAFRPGLSDVLPDDPIVAELSVPHGWDI
jgi:hypothetical protein